MSENIYETQQAIVTYLSGGAYGPLVQINARNPRTGEWQEPIQLLRREWDHIVADCEAGRCVLMLNGKHSLESPM